MGRRDYQYVAVSGVGGINQQLSLADPERELADALNVYAPNGEVIQRPGYVGAAVPGYASNESPVDTGDTLVEATIGTLVNTDDLSNLAAGKRWYMVFTTTVTNADYPTGVVFNLLATNTNLVSAAVDYWNGTTWAPLQGAERNSIVLSSGHLIGTSAMAFPWPRDLTSTTLGGATGYMFRFTILNGTGTTLDATVTTDPASVGITTPTTSNVIVAQVVGQFPGSKLYVMVNGSSNSNHVLSGSIRGPEVSAGILSSAPIAYGKSEPASHTVVPQFGDLYVSYDQTVTAYNVYSYPTTATLRATVEDALVLVGPGARYDPLVVQWRNAWPEAKYILFFGGEMWAANLRGSPYSVCWSAPVPAYKVWPILNEEVLMENDNSPITGLVGYQEHATVFKNDSIWKMVDAGLSEFSLQTYAPVRVVNGVGCVSNSSIVEVKNRLIFLAEDGVYVYEGTSQVEKISDRIDKYIKRITPGRRPFCTAVNWKSKSLYLLSVSLDGSDANNYVLVYDYKNDSWWVWNDIEAQLWLLDEDAADNERLYFADKYGRMYEMDSGLTSHGTAISSSVVTQRLGYSHTSKRLRLVSLNSQNISRTATVEVSADDAPFGATTNQSATFTYTDANEEEYGTAIYDDALYTSPRDKVVDEGFLASGRWFQVKVSHSTKNAKFAMNDLQVGLVPVGRR